MSLRSFGGKVLKHGISVLNQAPKGKLVNNNKLHVRLICNSVKPLKNNLSQKNNFVKNNKYRVFRNIGVQISQRARQVLFDDVLNRVQNNQIFQKTSKNCLYGHSAPLLSLVGVAAIGQGFLTKDEELEGICWELRQCMSKVQWNRDLNYQEIAQDDNVLNLTGFTFGAPIAKGSNAVVYSVELSPNVALAGEEFKEKINFSLALKMMFNYDIQSNSLAILKGMYRETVPSPVYFNNQGISDIEYEFLNASRHLPAHPNIVKILSVFTDFVPELEQCREMYPAALPKRIHPHGEGRNMSLFILMKKYHLNLQEFLNSTEKPSLRTSVILLTQILEGVAHLTANNIAHRDLKADNILLDLKTDSRCPLAVISDFGCCLAEKSCDLSIPYTSFNVDKGGNTALMAPEIITKRPGPFTRLNYHKSDLWAVGAIAYEIFGNHNPFYGDRGSRRLNSSNYKENDLPRLNNNVPKIVTRLINNLLKRDPNDRLQPEIAATVCQLFLWAPKTWMEFKKTGGKFPNYQEILEWLLNLAAKVLYERRNLKHCDENMCFAEYSLISTFLCRIKLQNVKLALLWIQEEENNNI